MKAAGRERLLLDFGWRFHFGHASDPAKDFGYGADARAISRRREAFMPAGTIAFDDSDWRRVDLPHDWAVELPFENDPALQSKGFYPLGRNYPATSVGWYRRVFELPAEDAGKRITIEFDGAYRETMVVFNGFYIGRHSGGYDPFSFDLTDFANPGGQECAAGARGRHGERWLVLRGRGNLSPRVAGEDASRACAAVGHVCEGRRAVGEASAVDPHRCCAIDDKTAQNVRVVSTVLGPSGKTVGKTASDCRLRFRMATRKRSSRSIT